MKKVSKEDNKRVKEFIEYIFTRKGLQDMARGFVPPRDKRSN